MTACELAQVAAPDGENVMVVEAVLRVGASRQSVLLHRSIDDGAIAGDRGADVTITKPDGEEFDFVESHFSDCIIGNPDSWQIDLDVDFACYRSLPSHGRFVRPGATYDLHVETADGQVVRGRTTVPEAPEFRTPAVSVDRRDRTAWCALPNHTFTLTWTRADGAWSYIITTEISQWGDELRAQGVEVPDPLELTGVSVSASDTTLVFPRNLGLFQRADHDQRVFAALEDGLPEGSRSVLVVLAADPNYTNAIRGGRFNPSGNVRFSSVVGDGVGVFGSVVPLVIRSHPSPQGQPLEPCPVPAPGG
ncbi:MAG: DUF4249 family protein [Gemmatimonadota bacterium]